MGDDEIPVEAPKQGFMLSEAMYTKMKFLVQIVLPALGTLYFTLSNIWGLPGAEQVMGTLSALAIFFGLLLGLSTKNFDQSEARYDGAMHFTPNPTGEGGAYLLELKGDPANIQYMDKVTFKVDSPPQA
jgi:hypothetical protein